MVIARADLDDVWVIHPTGIYPMLNVVYGMVRYGMVPVMVQYGTIPYHTVLTTAFDTETDGWTDRTLEVPYCTNGPCYMPTVEVVTLFLHIIYMLCCGCAGAHSCPD